MKFQLVGKSFQSWKQFSLKVSGFTIVVGSSNRGKTAIIRALRGVLRNQVSAAFIRHGQKAAELSLLVDGGPTADLSRNAKTTVYTVNGEEYAKLAGEVPPPIQALNVHEISIGSTKLDPTFAGQFDSQFMMDLSPGDLNAVFGLFSNTEQLNQGKKNISQSNTEINSQAKLLASEVQSGYVKMAALGEILAEFEALEPRYEASSAAIQSLQTTQDLLTRWREVRKTAKRYRAVAERPLPDTARLSERLSLGKQIRQAQRLREYVAVGRAATAMIDLKRMGAFGRVARAWVYLRQRRELLRRIEVILEVTEIDEPSDGELLRRRQNVRDARSWATTKEQVSQLRDEIERRAATLSELHDQLHELTKDTTQCPQCGYQFTKE